MKCRKPHLPNPPIAATPLLDSRNQRHSQHRLAVAVNWQVREPHSARLYADGVRRSGLRIRRLRGGCDPSSPDNFSAGAMIAASIEHSYRQFCGGSKGSGHGLPGDPSNQVRRWLGGGADNLKRRQAILVTARRPETKCGPVDTPGPVKSHCVSDTRQR